MLMRNLFLSAAAAALFPAAAASQVHHFTSGSARYDVGGVMMGEAMAPWEAHWLVRDTVIGGQKMVSITQLTLRPEIAATFRTTAIVEAATGRAVELNGENGGREPGSYALRIGGGKLTGTTQPAGGAATKIDLTVPDGSVPSLAVPFIVAARDLKDGDNIAMHVFVLQGSGGALFQYDMQAVVSSGTFTRGASGAAEPVWIVTGGGGYPAIYRIAKSDRALLQMVIPQGTVGVETDTFASVIKN